MDDLLAEFLAETREMLAAIGGELVAWEAQPDDRARLDAIFRFVHTVKGNCGFFDFPRLEALSHAAEDALADARAGRRPATAALVTAVLAVIDRIAAIVDAIEDGGAWPVDDDATLIAALAGGDGAASPALAQPASPHSPASGAQRTIRLPVSLLDDVMASVSDVVLARNDLARRLRDAGGDLSLRAPFERLSTLLDGVREAVTRMRMQRIEHLYAGIPRLVRDLAAELGKQVTVDLQGGEVELDREMIETIRDPLTHIIRNAIDHGIEPAAQRLAAGKAETGRLLVSARQSGNRILLTIADDGRGIDGAALAEKAVAANAVSLVEAKAMSADQRLALVFEPGLSTAGEVTAVSGRGVGMDVVRSNIERVGGAIALDSTPGKGTRIELSLPLTLSIVPSLTVRSGGQLFALPRSYVEEIIHGRAGHIEFARAGDALLATVRDRRIACVTLAGVLATGEPAAPEACTLVLLRLNGGDLFALACDQVLDHEDLVIKPLAPAIMATGLYAGSTLLDDGNPVLMLDVAGIARKARLLDGPRRLVPSEAGGRSAQAEREGEPALLFTGLDGRRRAVRLALVQRIERVPSAALDLAGTRPRAVIDGSLLDLAGSELGPLPAGETSVLRLGDGEREIAYVIERIIDTVALPEEIAPSPAPGAVEGTVLIDGEPADLLDGHWLFAAEVPAQPSGRRPRCLLPAADPWARAILAPLIANAGYEIVDECYPGTAEVALAPGAAG
ncbi:MAG: chemotaxis protein CheA, partial [Cypionkella sp.]